MDVEGGRRSGLCLIPLCTVLIVIVEVMMISLFRVVLM